VLVKARFGPISAYKPKDSFRAGLIASAGMEETAWRFVQQHLREYSCCCNQE
jgi:hypothetical protein